MRMLLPLRTRLDDDGRRHTRAFTLMEAMVALSIAAIIVGAGTAAVMGIHRVVANTRRQMAVWGEAKRIVEYLSSRAQGSGGGALRPWDAIVVENQDAPSCAAGQIPGLPPCDGTDRITMYLPLFMPQCEVTGVHGYTLDVADFPRGSGQCCLDFMGPLSWLKQHAVLVRDQPVGPPPYDEGLGIGLYLPFANHHCALTLSAGHHHRFVRNGALPMSALDTGTIVAAEKLVYFVSTVGQSAPTHLKPHSLYLWQDENGDGRAVDAELSLMHDMVYDLQIGLGYDGAPSDGRVDDHGDELDEWRHNHPRDDVADAGTFDVLSEDQIKMIEVAVLVGTPVLDKQASTASALDGPQRTVPGVFLAAAQSRVFLRNINLFVQ